MPKGIRFKDGRIIDFQDTDWSIEVDPSSDFIEFIHSTTGKRYKFTSDGNIEADQGFKLASEILFEGTDFFIDASTGQLKISDGTNTFTFDDTGSVTIPNAFEVLSDFTVSGKLEFAGSEWEIDVNDTTNSLEFFYPPTGETFAFDSDGSFTVPDSSGRTDDTIRKLAYSVHRRQSL